MATKAMFIDYEHLVKNTPIRGTVNEDMVDSILPIAQDKNIEPLLGTTLYRKLTTDIENTLSLSGDYKTLMDDYIAPALVLYATVELIPYMTFSFSNKGLVEQSSDTSEPIEDEKILRISRQTLSSAEWYGERLVDYLCANLDLFPEYRNPESDEDDLQPSRTAYESPFFIPNRSRRISDFNNNDIIEFT